MVVCPTCQAAVFFDMDGNPHVGDEAPPLEEMGSDLSTQEPMAEIESVIAPFFENSPSEPEYNFEQSLEDQSTEPVAYQEQQNSYLDSPSAGLQKFEDVTEFANSNLDSGALLYDIQIAGIDLADIRYEVFEELQDSRLALDLDQLKDSILDGVLEIKSLNPIKAAVIIKRIRKLSVQMTWRQYAVSQNS